MLASKIRLIPITNKTVIYIMRFFVRFTEFVIEIEADVAVAVDT